MPTRKFLMLLSMLLIPNCKTRDNSVTASTPSSTIKVTLSPEGSPLSGYKNSRLLPQVGPDTSKASLRYGVEVIFDLSATDYPIAEIQIKRQASRHVFYNLVLGNKTEARESIVNGVADHPIPDNIQRIETDGSTLIKIADSPGITQPFILNDPKSYPIRMNAEFIVHLEYRGAVLATAKYQIALNRQTITDPTLGHLIHD